MITIEKTDEYLLLEYYAERTDAQWVDRELQEHNEVTLSRVFTFETSDLRSHEEDSDPDEEGKKIFILGTKKNDYYIIDKKKLRTTNNVYIYYDLEINCNYFIAKHNVSILKKINDITKSEIFIGGNHKDAIPIKVFKKLLKSFPTTTEINHYINSRISRILNDFYASMFIAQEKFEHYIKTKMERNKITPNIIRKSNITEYELNKFIFIRDELQTMLKEYDSYTEKDWQKKIIDFLLLIFPKYVACLENLHIEDFYSKSGTRKKRYIDITLVDANGTIDIIEIKKPFPDSILSNTKYRDNYIPKKELSGSIMQAEKYIFHLSKWGIEGEKKICKDRKNELPQGIKIHITNPKAMIIIGRANNFDHNKAFDFEIIRRKYANIIDIMTYDDIINRLNNIIERLQKSIPRNDFLK